MSNAMQNAHRMRTTTDLRDGLYQKPSFNGIIFLGEKPYTFCHQIKQEQMVRIKNGTPYLADMRGEIVEELVPLTQEECVKRGVKWPH